MSAPMGGTRDEARRRLVERSARDEGLRRRLLADPKGTVEQELGVLLPETLEVRAVEESVDTIYLVLPPKASVAVGEGGELSERDLENVAGGVRRPASTVIEGCRDEL